jgi:hypothetical protein
MEDLLRQMSDVSVPIYESQAAILRITAQVKN